MPRKRAVPPSTRLSSEQIAFIQERMRYLAERNPSWGIPQTDYRTLFCYLATLKTTYLYDDELFERLTFVDQKMTGKTEELLDAYLILDAGNEIQLKLFQFKFTDKYDMGSLPRSSTPSWIG
jgi:hypothetical protein